MPHVTPLERFMPKFVIVDAGYKTPCWLWQGRLSTQGYGRFSGQNPKTLMAHCWAYVHFVGPIPDGRELDHLCRNRSCVNPAHLEPVSHRENMLRGKNAAATNASKTHCIRGHEFTTENTWFDPKRKARHCRKCRADFARARRAAQAQTV